MFVRLRQNPPLRQLAARVRATQRLESTCRAAPAGLQSWRKTIQGLPAGSRRHLATAMDSPYTHDEMLPFDNLGPSMPSLEGAATPLYEVRSFDDFAPFGLSAPDSTPRLSRRTNMAGIPGQLEDSVALFDACIKVGHLDRASLVLKRIGSFNVLSAYEMINLQNRYLREIITSAQAHPQSAGAADLHRWFETQIRAELLPITTETIAYMLKASFLSAEGTRLRTFVTRYMELLPEDTGLGELHLGDVLSDHELSQITQICPEYSLTYDEAMLEGEAADEVLHSEQIEAILDSKKTPEVLSTPQKGSGLKSVKRSLSLFDGLLDGYSISSLSPPEQREVQARLERDCIDAAMDRWREENQALKSMGVSTASTNGKLAPSLHEWHKALEARIKDEFKLIEEAIAAPKKDNAQLDRCLYGPFLLQSTPTRLAAVAVLSMLGSMSTHGHDKGVPVHAAVNNLSRVVEEDVRAQKRDRVQAARKAKARLHRKNQEPQKPQEATAAAPPKQNAATLNDRRPGAQLEIAEITKTYAMGLGKTDDSAYWPVPIRMKVGAVLVAGLTEVARITVVKEDPVTGERLSQSQPAFAHSSKIKRGSKIGIIMANSTVSDLVRQEPRGEFLARHLPMVVRPDPWRSWDKGGYISSMTPLVRIKSGETEQRAYTQAALQRGDMDQVLKGMDVLGKTAWNINRPVFDVMLEVWNSGAEFGAIPPLNPDITFPEEPEADADPSVKSMWLRSLKAADNLRSGLHSLRCSMNFQLEVAKAFRDQTFYFPHNVDFRGRAYPIPTYLNHMGADNVRGLLRFSKGKKLGETGLRWLKVHVANVFGYDKASLSERAAFADEHLEEIYDSALNPLTGNMWWKQAEDPWQCLAACFELKAALDAPDPTQFVSHLPIHQDGTCNGLQHYAALGGDAWGAKQVNLEPGDRPADVYSAVANLVEEAIAKEAAAGEPFAKVLSGKIKRKVVKQTVMTNVYGVTFSGARKQILRQLVALYPTLHAETGFDSSLLASYVARKVFDALSTMFSGAHDIQKWLGIIGGRVCRSLSPDQIEALMAEADAAPKKGSKTPSGKMVASKAVTDQFRSTIVWTTPLRMPVAQPYRKSSAQIITTCLQDLVVPQNDRADPVNSRKQLQAFPPNFIHSLDASHMILSALECDSRGLTFAAVHDSFWTHAAEVDTMNEILRDAFIRIHSDDVIGRLAEEFRVRYKGSYYLAKIPTKSPLAKRISALRKTKEKGTTLQDELLEEYKRHKLLDSKDPEARAKGEAMITCASLYEEMQEEESTKAALEADDADGLEDAAAAAEAGITEDSTEPSSAIETESLAAELDGAEDAPEEDLSAAMATEGFNRKLQTMQAGGYFENALQGKLLNKGPRTRRIEYMQVWLPLVCPPIPPKGDFDVRRLKESKYFFS